MEAQEHADGHGSSGETSDHYRLLQVDPDAPQLLVEEAYWHLVGKLLAGQAVTDEAQRELVALNAAYTLLAHPQRRRAYDATVKRVAELRLERAQRDRPAKKRAPANSPESPPDPPRDYYELLHVDRTADPTLIERAYSILRVLHSGRKAGELPGEFLAEITAAFTTLLDGESRAVYDRSLEEAAAASESQQSETPAGGTGGSIEPQRGRAWPVRAMAALSTVFAAIGEGDRTNRGKAREPADGGGREARAGVGGQREGQRRRPRREKAAGRLLDERLLRDAAPSPAITTQERRDGPRLGRLIVHGPKRKDEAVDLGEAPVTLGCGRECDVRLGAEPGSVAPAHAQIWFTGERFVIRSLDPTHPTILCGQRVNWAGLDDGDEIEIGPYRLRFEAGGAWSTPPEFLTMQPDTTASVEEISERRE